MRDRCLVLYYLNVKELTQLAGTSSAERHAHQAPLVHWGTVMEVEVLDTQIIYKKGCYMRVRRWLKGIHPERGVISKGWSGWETIEEKDVIRPIHTFHIKENDATQSVSITRIVAAIHSFECASSAASSA